MLRDLEQDLLQAQISLENAEYALDDAEEGTLTEIDTDDGVRVVEIVDDWQVEIKEMQLELAQGSLEDALKALEEALEKSPEIIAPFDGYITTVNIEGGDEVLTGTVAVELADPDRFEADILVSEMDIMQVELGGKAWVEVDAMSGVRLPAKVTHISPTATIQSGVVNYDVKVELEPLEAVIEEQQEQESETGQVSTVIPEDFQLREGLTVTVSLVVEEKTDILLLPNGVITTQGGQTYVQVLLPDSTIEERAITTGTTDYVNTEITEGLSEGEEVIVPQGATYTSTTTEQQEDSPGGGMMIPGMGGPPR
jgi:HlyD family secretion protein